MSTNTIPQRFPKVASPYHRAENSNGDYVVNPDGQFIGVDSRFEWAFNRADEVEAVEKLDGTNMAIYIGEHEHGGYSVQEVATRMGDKSMNRVDPFGPRTNHHYISRAVQNTIQRGYTEQLVDEYGPGWFFGEAVGPKFQGNPHKLDEHLFIPFDWLRDKCQYNSYGKYPTNFDAITDWFSGEGESGISSLFASRMHGQGLTESRPDHDTFIEGLILIHPDFDGRIRPADLTEPEDQRGVNELVKIRRDMWGQFQTDEWPLTKWGH